MDLLKKIFPFSYKFAGSVTDLVIGVLVHLVVGLLGGLLIGLTAGIPVVNWFCGIAGTALDIYVVAGIVIQFLLHFKVIKD